MATARQTEELITAGMVILTVCLKTALIQQAKTPAKSCYPPSWDQRPRDTLIHKV